MRRRLFRVCAALVACFNVSALDAFAQSYPVKPIRMLVGFAPGGSTDVVARNMAQKLSENLGQNVIVENRPGASGALATERVATSPADGYTLLMMSISDTVLPALRKLPYDVERDLTPVSLTTILPIVLLVHPSVPARNIKELTALARSRPGKLNYGSAGIGSASHLPGELFNLMAKVNIVHVPYKGGMEGVVAAVSGQVDMSYASITAGLPLLANGKLRALAVTSTKRASALPAVPTFDESGLPGYERSGWNGVLAPAGLRKDIVATLNAAIGKVMNAREMKEWLNKQGLESQTGTPEQFSAFIQREVAQNARLIKLTGTKAE
ncbi:MAG: tripartite tricarboxylate transporter substrate binding protein [Betaproteobacteria bacterium]|nr:tripartite tricarboxylate transporter substrate binding protein [Betaproteobacteria bacterium]